jgi:hypothetical protein
VAWSASMGCGSTSSITSEKSLPRTPPVWKPSASAPANGPRPTAKMKMRAQKSSGMERSRLSPSVLPQNGIARSKRVLGEGRLSSSAQTPPRTVRPERMPSGRAMSTANTVPMRDSASVSTPLQNVARRNFGDRSGGNIPPTKLPIWSQASP